MSAIRLSTAILNDSHAKRFNFGPKSPADLERIFLRHINSIEYAKAAKFKNALTQYSAAFLNFIINPFK
jgi:hypothetical protein